MKAIRTPSLILAAILQVIPITRLAAVWQQPVSPLWAVIFRWVGSTAAALGSVQAVSGASTVITNPLTAKGTNGIPFKQFRLTTAPDQAHYWTATGLPPGVTLSGKSGQTFWALIGTPAAAGVFPVKLTAKDQSTSGSDRTISATLTITIVANGTVPTITTQPISQSVSAGSSVTFTVAASGSGPLSYQWNKDGQPLSGGTASALLLQSAQPSDSGSYTVLVRNSNGSVLSSAATLTVSTPVAPPAIVSGPNSLTLHAGQLATFSAQATGSEPLQYQWYHDTTALPGEDASTLTLAGIDTSSAGEYSVEVKNSTGSIRSAAATLKVTVLQILSCTETADSTVITWNGITGETYLFHAMENLGDAWQPLTVGTPVLANGVMSVTLPKASTPGHFFQISAYP